MLPRRLVRRLLALTGTLMLVVAVMYLGPTALPLPLLQEDLVKSSSQAPPPAHVPSTPALQLLYAKNGNDTKSGGKDNLTTPKATIAQKPGSQTAQKSGSQTAQKSGSQTAQKSQLQKVLDEVEKKLKFEVNIPGDTDSYVQDYAPETWVEVKKVNPRGKTRGKGRNKNARRPQTPISNPKYLPEVLRDRALSFSNTSVSLSVCMSTCQPVNTRSVCLHSLLPLLTILFVSAKT